MKDKVKNLSSSERAEELDRLEHDEWSLSGSGKSVAALFPSSIKEESRVPGLFAAVPKTEAVSLWNSPPESPWQVGTLAPQAIRKLLFHNELR